MYIQLSLCSISFPPSPTKRTIEGLPFSFLFLFSFFPCSPLAYVTSIAHNHDNYKLEEIRNEVTALRMPLHSITEGISNVIHQKGLPMQALSTPHWLLLPQEWNEATPILSFQWSYSFPPIVLLSCYLHLTHHGA